MENWNSDNFGIPAVTKNKLSKPFIKFQLLEFKSEVKCTQDEKH